MVLSLGLSQGCSETSAVATVICKPDLALDGPLPRWLPPRAAGGRPDSCHPDLSIGLLEHAHDMSVNQPKEMVHNGLMLWPWGSHTITSVIAYWWDWQVSPTRLTQRVTTRRTDSGTSWSLTTIPMPEANNATSLLDYFIEIFYLDISNYKYLYFFCLPLLDKR